MRDGAGLTLTLKLCCVPLEGNLTLRLRDISSTRHFAYDMVTSPTGQFAYETVLLDTSPTTWTFRLHDISPPICPLSVCPVCNVLYCGQTVGRIKMKLGMQYGGRPQPRRVSAKGAQHPSPFRPMSIVATVAHLSYC